MKKVRALASAGNWAFVQGQNSIPSTETTFPSDLRFHEIPKGEKVWLTTLPLLKSALSSK